MKGLAAKKVIVVLVVALVVVIVAAVVVFKVGGFFRNLTPAVENSTVVNITQLKQQIVSIGELATLEYNYTTLITMKDSHSIKGWNIPLTQKSYIIAVDGTMKIGIDVSDVSVDASEDTKTISITIPKAKILSHELHEDSMEVLEESSGLFNPVSIEDWPTMAIAKKQEIEDEVSESDAFVRAEDDAVRMLQALIVGVVPEEYTVTVARR